jgi:hypothetical protein
MNGSAKAVVYHHSWNALHGMLKFKALEGVVQTCAGTDLIFGIYQIQPEWLYDDFGKSFG